MTLSGKFITFEGGEGTGKSTQLRLLSEYLTRKGIENIQTKEPGGTEIGLELRRILVTGDKDKMDAVAEALMYYADRRIHLTKKIWPALEKGEWGYPELQTQKFFVKIFLSIKHVCAVILDHVCQAVVFCMQDPGQASFKGKRQYPVFPAI